MAFIRARIRGSAIIGVRRRIIVNRMGIKEAGNNRFSAVFAVKGI